MYISWQLALQSVTLAALANAVKALYHALFGPLAKIPGPLPNRLSRWPLRWATIQGKRIFYVDALHAQYGPCVQVSPDEVYIADVASAKDIHRIGGNYIKAPWYSKFNQENLAETDKGIFSMVEPKVHAARRRLFANAFSKSSLSDWEDVLHQKVRLTMAGIASDAKKNGKANVLDWFTYMANDIIATLSFGDSFKTLEKGEKTQFVRDLQSVMMLSGMSVELSWLSPILRLLQPNHRLALAAKGAIARTRERELKDAGERTTIFAKMVASGDSQQLSLAQIEREASNLIVAGSDTTAVTLTYLVYAVLSFDPEIRQKLEEELSHLHEGFSAQEAGALPFLSCVIQETLRLYGAAPGALPRIVPLGGRMLGGQYIPAGTIVSTQAYTLHRNASIFQNPNEFWPERWQSPSQEMKDAYMPFGGGVRGLHLAHMELALAAATFFREFPSAKLASGTNESSMQFENHFLIAPKSHSCEIRL